MSWGHALNNLGEKSWNIMISLYHHWFYQRTLNFTFIIIIIPIGSRCLVWINPTHILESSKISRIFSENKPRPFWHNRPFMDGEVSATRCFRSGGMATMDQAPVCVKATENKKNTREKSPEARQLPWSCTWAMKVYMNIYRGWNTTQLCGDYYDKPLLGF